VGLSSIALWVGRRYTVGDPAADGPGLRTRAAAYGADSLRAGVRLMGFKGPPSRLEMVSIVLAYSLWVLWAASAFTTTAGQQDAYWRGG